MRKVSIIIPVYNSEKYLSQCIKSILSQTYGNIELILINDGSTDKSLEICRKYAKQDKRVVLRSIENSGVSTARNIGLDIMSGEYVTFVDSDDWIENNTVELAVESMERENVDIVIWSYFKNYPSAELPLTLVPGGTRKFTDEKSLLYLKSIFSKYRSISNEDVPIGTTMCKMYKTNFIKKIKLRFNQKLIRAEDMIFALNAFQSAESIYYIDQSLYHYRMNPDSISFSYKYIEDTLGPFNALIHELNVFKSKVMKSQVVKDLQVTIDCRIIQILTWHVKYNYFHKESPLNLFERRKQVKKILLDKRYKDALNNVDLGYLPKESRVMVKLFRKNMVLVFYLIQKLREIKRK